MTKSPAANAAPQRAEFTCFFPLTTRWADNDIYGHVNNVVYYAYFDTVANRYLIDRCGLDIHSGRVIAFVVSSSCDYFSPVAFPDQLEGGLRVNRLGNSSVEYGIAIFKAGQSQACAAGSFTHVFVDRQSQRPVPIDGALRRGLEAVLSSHSGD